MRCIELCAVVLLDHMACFCQSRTTSDHRDHSHGPGPHRRGIVTSKMNRCSRSGTLECSTALLLDRQHWSVSSVRRLCTSADYSQVGSPLLQLLEASLEIPRETPEDAASGGQRVPQSHNPAYLGSLRLDTHQAGMCLWSSVWKRPSRRHIILAQTRSQVPLYCINT